MAKRKLLLEIKRLNFVYDLAVDRCVTWHNKNTRLQAELKQLKEERQKATAAGGYAAWTGKHIANLRDTLTKIKVDAQYAQFHHCGDKLYYKKIEEYIEQVLKE